jgi:hypothetical protein
MSPYKDPEVQKAHNRVYQSEYYRKNSDYYKQKAKKRREGLQEWYDGIKEHLKCTKCDESHSATLEFHHPDDNKDFDIASSMRHGYSKERILKEMEKCVVLCSNCHKKLHYDLRKKKKLNTSKLIH